MDLSIIIVNYKSLGKTRRCVSQVIASDLSGLSYEIIAVDNASGDNIDALKNEFSNLKIIKAPANLGMGGGNNLGIRNSYGENLLILNPDTYLKPDAIKKLLGFLLENPRVGIVGPKLLNPDGQLQYSCLRFHKFFTPIIRRTRLSRWCKKEMDRYLMADFDHASAREVDWLMGSCLMVKRELMKAIGELFDERYFMFFEDTDLCRRAKLAGYKVIYFPQAEAVHDHTRASAQGKWYFAPFINRLARAHIASWLKYFWKWK